MDEMSIMPEGEVLRKAIKWISEEQECRPEKTINKLINEACIRFDLSPNESEFIIRFYRKENVSQK
jgi:hypothetical protein